MNVLARLDDRVLMDLSRAVKWYEKKEEGLGKRFSGAFFASVEKAARSSAACSMFQPLAARDIRHCLVSNFPYAFYFRSDASTMFVFLLFHGARDPRRLQRMIAARSS